MCLMLAASGACGSASAPDTKSSAVAPGLGPLDRLAQAPRAVANPDAVVGISASLHATCYRLADGRVGCAGSNTGGLLFRNGQGVDGLALSDRVVPSDSAIHLGSGHACALNALSEVRCWGSPLRGKRGDGCRLTRDVSVACDEGPVPDPRAVITVAGMPPVVQLAGGWDSTCARTEDGEVWCWGANIDGELGVEELDESSRPSRVPVPPAAELRGGAHHYCIVTEESREVWCWGSRFIDDVPNPMERSVRTPKRMTTVGALSRGARLDVTMWGACVIDAEHVARCWGSFEGADHSPVLGEDPFVLFGVHDVVGSNDYTCAVMVGGEVSCPALQSPKNAKVPSNVAEDWVSIAMPFEGPAARLSATPYSVCALSEAGEVACWGEGAGVMGLEAEDDELAAPTLVRFEDLAPSP